MKYLISIVLLLSAFVTLSSYNTDHILVDILMSKDMPHVAGSEIRKIERNRLRDPEYIMVRSHNLETIYIEFLHGNYSRVKGLLAEMEYNETDPDVIKQVTLLQGKNYYMLNEFSKAKPYFKDYSVHYTQSANLWEAYYYLSEIYYSESMYSKAYEMSRKAIDLNDSPIVITLHIKNLIAYNMDEQAASYIEILYKTDPVYGDYSRILINNFYLKKGMYKKVIDAEEMDSGSQFYSDFTGQQITAEILLNNLPEAEERLKNADIDSELKAYFKLLILLKGMKYSDAEKHIEANLNNASNEEIRRKTDIISIALFSSDKDKLDRYNEFINGNDLQMKSMAVFYKGLSYMKKNDYEQCISELMKLEGSRYYYDAQFIIGECFYYLGNNDEALVFYKKYIAESVDGFYTDQAYFKTGLLYIFKDDNDSAKKIFRKIIENYKHSDYYADAAYYLGEIYYADRDLGTAVNYLHESYIAGNRNDKLLNRLSEVQQKLGNNEASMEALDQIQDIDKYKFNRIFTEGNILYSNKSYTKALDKYKEAMKAASTKEERSKAEKQIGWCYYNMEDFKTASKYLKNNSVNEDGQEFLEAGADAAYENQDYASAIDFYTDYMNTKKDGRLFRIQNRLAESYYNMQNYAKASEFFVKAALKAGTIADFKVSLEGIVKSNKARDLEYMPVLESVGREIGDPEMKLLIAEYRIKSEQNAEKWNSVINLCKEYLKKADNPEIVSILGQAYGKLDLNHKAYELYEDYHQPEGRIFAHWGELLVKDRFFTKAETKLDSASARTNDQELLLKILRLQKDNDMPGFSETYERLKSNGDLRHKALADIELIEKLFAQEQYSSIDPLLTRNRLNEDDEIKTKVQLFSGMLLYFQRDYEKAIVELLKISYMFNGNEEINLQAKYYLVKCYIETGEKAKADNMYSMIRADLPEEETKELDKILIK